MRILLWNLHGGYSDSFLRGRHEYLIPRTEAGGTWGSGRGNPDFPASVVDIDPREVAEAGVDVVVLQRTEELPLAETLLQRRLGVDIPAIFIEHNTPKGEVPTTRHFLAGQRAIPVVHVTHFNDLMWDTGDAPTTVIEHGVPDRGALYTGELQRMGAVINEAKRRWRVTGTDLLPRFAQVAPIDVFGIGASEVQGALGPTANPVADGGDLPPSQLHPQLARRRVYLHPLRWTSLGLSLLEAMHAAMPVVVLAATEATRAVPPEAGFVSADVRDLVAGAKRLMADPDEARRRGAVAREVALARYGLGRFLADWDAVLDDAVASTTRARRRRTA